MSVIKKPDLKIFAQDAKTGEIETFPDVLRGWGISLDRTAGKPPLEWFNAIGKRADEWLMYLTQRGVAEWDVTLSYPKTAIVQFNSIIYVSVKETKGEQPDKSQASWSTLGLFMGLGNYYTKTETNIKFQPIGNYQPSGDYATNTALNSGLDGKFDKAGGIISKDGQCVTLKNINEKQALFLAFQAKDNTLRGYVGAPSDLNRVALVNSKTSKVLTLTETGELTYDGKNVMLVGDFGLGALRAVTGGMDTVGLPNFNDMEATAFYRSDDATQNARYPYSPMLGMTRRGGANGLGFRSQIQVDYLTGKLSSRGAGGATWSAWQDPMYAGDGGWMSETGYGLPKTITKLSDYRVNSVGYAYAATQTDLFKSSNHHFLNIFGYSTRAYGNQIAFTLDERIGYRCIVNNAVSPWYDFYTTKNTTIDHNGQVNVSSIVGLSDCQVGIPLPWPQSTAPSGYLVCNGQLFNKTTYPLLAKAYPSGVLPDLRGEFIRGLDSGRNIDSGRTVLSNQVHAFEQHAHNFTLLKGTGNGSNENAALRTLAIGTSNSTFNTENTGSNETRPRNVAFLYIVRAA